MDSLEEFQQLVEKWHEEYDVYSSNINDYVTPSYKKIIEMGGIAVPFIINELRIRPDHWFVALNAITGENPVKQENRGRIAKMAQDWIDWYEYKNTTFGLYWFSADNDDLVGEAELPAVTPENVRDWFFLSENDPLTDCFIVRASQRRHIAGFVKEKIDLNKYDYFLECFSSETKPVGLREMELSELDCAQLEKMCKEPSKTTIKPLDLPDAELRPELRYDPACTSKPIFPRRSFYEWIRDLLPF